MKTIEITPILLTIIIVLALFELTMKIFALWKAARNQQKGWFIAILLLNTAGILPLIYLKRK